MLGLNVALSRGYASSCHASLVKKPKPYAIRHHRYFNQHNHYRQSHRLFALFLIVSVIINTTIVVVIVTIILYINVNLDSARARV